MVWRTRVICLSSTRTSGVKTHIGICFISGNTRIYTNIPAYTRIYPNIHEYTRLHPNIHEYTRIYTNIPEYTRIYPKVPEYTRIYTNIPEYARVCTYSMYILNLLYLPKCTPIGIYYILLSYMYYGLSDCYRISIILE